MKHRIPSEEIKAKFLKLFEEGKTPSKALFIFKTQLRTEKGNNYYICAGDRGELPDPQWVYYLYYKTFKKHFGFSHGEQMISSLKDAIQEYNTECMSDTAAMKELENGNFAIAIVTPLMSRISCELNECGEILFIDASANMDRYGCKVFMIYTNSCAGGIPVGTLILTSESTLVISEGLKLWKQLFIPKSLAGRGTKGPKIFMSDDSAAERSALHSVFPESILLLCIFHVLQATWRYLWDSNHGVPLHHRYTLYSIIKEMIYSKNEEELASTFNKALQQTLVKTYPIFITYLTNLYQRKEQWALCFRKGLITRGQNTNNISEAGVKIVKDVILERTKAYSPVQLFFFIVNDLDAFYEMKLLDVAANRPAQYLKNKFIITNNQKNNLEYKIIDNNTLLYEVRNKKKNTQYNVDLDLGMCSCPQGDTGLDVSSKKPKLAGNKQIGTQPTARSRRKTQIKGRKNLTAGRTPKWKKAPEHGYVKGQIISSGLPKVKRKSKAPHSLAYCVENNKALGGTHSSK